MVLTRNSATEINVKQLLIDTASIHHSVCAINKRVDYGSLVSYMRTQYVLGEIVFFVDENAISFIKYLKSKFENDPVTIIMKKPFRKKIAPGQRVWYLSFAVEMALTMGLMDRRMFLDCLEPIIVSTDIEIQGILKQYKDTTLYGIGIPKLLRDHVKWSDIPSHCLMEKPNVIA